MLGHLDNLPDLYAIWNRDDDKLAALGKKLGKSEAGYLPLKPDMERYEKLRRANGETA